MLGPTVWLMLSGLFYSLRISDHGGTFPKPLSAKEEEYYLTLSAQGDIDARNILVERNLRLVAHIMKKYYAQASEQEDLISIGTIGLIKGISTFKPEKGARLATYAARCIENEILMHFRGQRKSMGDVSLSDYIETGSDGSALSFMDVICSQEDLAESYSDREDMERLYTALNQALDDREKKVIVLRYGLGNREALTQNDVAELLGISRSYVSRIEKKAITKLRHLMLGSTS